MATVTGQLTVAASIQWKQQATLTGFTNATQSDTKSFSVQPSAATLTEILLYRTTIAAGADVTINLYQFTNSFGSSVTNTKLQHILFKGTGASSQMKIEPGASNPATLGLSGTSPAITLSSGDNGCCLLIADGAVQTLSNTVKNVKISNPGSQTLTLDVVALVGA